MNAYTVLISALVVGLGIFLAAFVDRSPELAAEVDPLAAVPPGRPGTGVVYCAEWGNVRGPWREIRADGRAVLLKPGVSGEPSRSLHGGYRWFLRVQELAGQQYADGSPRRALFAVRDDEHTVQLTDQAVLEPSPEAQPRWPLHGRDRLISWVARRWEGGEVREGGIYTAQIAYDAEDQIIGLRDQPQAPQLTLPLTRATDRDPWCRDLVPDIYSHDWSPDGGSIVYESLEQWVRVGPSTQTVSTDEANTSFQLLIDERGSDPVWSPDGTRIALKCARVLGPIVTVRPDGSDCRVIVCPDPDRPFAVGMPVWSPDGRHLAYLRHFSVLYPLERACDVEVCAAPLDYAEHINLTSDISVHSRPVAWR